MRSKLILWQIRLTDFSSHTVKLPKIKYVQIKKRSQRRLRFFIQRRIGFYEGKQIFINNLTKALQYRMITISVMIINIEQDASTELSVTVNNQKGGKLWLL